MGEEDSGKLRTEYAALAAQISKLSGNVALIESSRSGHDRPTAAGNTEKPIVLGATFDANTAEIRGQLESSIAAALSTPPALLGLGAAPASERRELQRQYVSSVARPVAGLIAAELGRVLGADVKLDVGGRSGVTGAGDEELGRCWRQHRNRSRRYGLRWTGTGKRHSYGLEIATRRAFCVWQRARYRRLGNEVVRFADIRKTFHVREANAL